MQRVENELGCVQIEVKTVLRVVTEDFEGQPGTTERMAAC